MKVVNLSGHKFTNKEKDIEIVVERPIKTFKPKKEFFVKKIAALIDKEVIEAIEKGAYIAVPGAKYLIPILIAEISGKAGFLPKYIWPVLEDGIYVWKKENSLDLQKHRTAVRVNRF